MEGLKCAISTGNIPVLHFFDSLGIEDLIDTDLAVWALRNARGDKGMIFYILGEWIDLQRRLSPLGPCRTDRLHAEIVKLQIEGMREDEPDKTKDKYEDARLALRNIVGLWPSIFEEGGANVGGPWESEDEELEDEESEDEETGGESEDEETGGARE